MYIENDDKGFFKKNREIWNKFFLKIELIDISNAPDFVGTSLYYGNEFIEPDVLENTVFTKDIYDDQLIIVLHSLFNNYLRTSLVKYKC